MATKLFCVLTCVDGLLPIKPHESHDKLKLLKLHYTVPMATKIGRIVTYFDWLLTKKLYNAFITWSCKVT